MPGTELIPLDALIPANLTVLQGNRYCSPFADKESKVERVSCTVEGPGLEIRFFFLWVMLLTAKMYHQSTSTDVK